MMLLDFLAAQTALVSALSGVTLDDFPPFGSPEWAEMFAVDVADSRLDPVPVAKPNRMTTYSITYKGEIAGFDVGRVFVDAATSDNGYTVAYRMEQKGVARWFSDAEARATARGTLVNGKIASHYYFNHDYERDDDQQYIELYREAGLRRLHLWTEPQYSFHESVPEAMALGSVDPMAALIELGFLPNTDRRSPCDRTVEVFDGRRRFDLIMTDDGEEWIRKGGKGRFEGMTYKCKLNQVKVGGYREKDSADITGDVWVYLAEVPAEFRTETFAYVPVMIRARQGMFTARLEGKNPVISAPDGRKINLGDLPRQKKPQR